MQQLYKIKPGLEHVIAYKQLHFKFYFLSAPVILKWGQSTFKW